MLSDAIEKYFKQIFPSRINKTIHSLSISSVAGGSINQSLKVTINKKDYYFCKINSVSKFPGLFEKEKNGLEILASTKVIRVPHVIDLFVEDDDQLLVMEWIEEGTRTEKFWNAFGTQLAALHKISNKQFGFKEDNYMGSLIQSNTWSDKWVDFFIEQRLKPQIKLAADSRLIDQKEVAKFDAIYRKLPDIFSTEPPVLIHGDLWSGNFLCDSKSQPVLIDPAVYYGNRNMDLAMTTLFGSFHRKFYESYDHAYPLAANHKEQWDACNLYPLLIHLNLFGSSYMRSINDIITRL